MTRREMVSSGGAALAGAIGVGGLSRIASAEDVTAQDDAGAAMFTWHTADIEMLSEAAPAVGTTRSGIGPLDEGGHVYVTHTITDANLTDGSADRIEQHVFVVPDGQLIGVGSVLARSIGRFQLLPPQR